jgi:ubiquitin-conjugating enzyme E2 G1
MQKKPEPWYSAGLVDDSNIYEWEVTIIGYSPRPTGRSSPSVPLLTCSPSPENTLYEGGLFKATLSFPRDYPLQPPKMTFKTEIWHPNVYPSGLVCISILHPPEVDRYGYEDVGERWLPVHTPQTILLSVISMVSEPPPVFAC